MPTISDRLKEQREALGLSQQVLADRCGIAARSQRNYESGERLPDAAYLAALVALGADVIYILTGQRDRPAPMVLAAEEQTLLDYFRDASKELRKAAIGVLLSGAAPKAKSSIHVGVHNGQRVEGDMTVQGSQYFGAQPPRTKPK